MVADDRGHATLNLRAPDAPPPHAFGATLKVVRRRSERDWRDLLARRAQFLATAASAAVGTVGALDERPGIHLVSRWWTQHLWQRHADLLVRAVTAHTITRGSTQIRLETIGEHPR